jgi:hypothetical protein
MTPDRKKPSVAFWATVVVVVVFAYVLSVGPACWFLTWNTCPEWAHQAYPWVYAPFCLPCPEPFRSMLRWYIGLWV